ncbi:MAG: hemolysin III family protein [Acidimicrobiales bacterium]
MPRLDLPADLDLSTDPYRIASLDPPSWRGRMHMFMVPVALVAAAVLVAATPGVGDRIAAAVYGLTLVNMFATSALFHRRRWGDVGWWRMRQLDHTAIYLFIAGSYTAIAGLGLDGWVRVFLLVAAWVGAGVGVLLRWLPFKPPFGMMNTLFLALGWASVIAMPAIWTQIGPTGAILIWVGGLFYTVGALLLGVRRPNPSQRHFGYHEVWHVNVTIAAALQFVAIATVVADL